MAINLITLSWLERLARAGALHGSSVLDLGPQDLISCPRPAVAACARRRHSPDRAESIVAAIFDGDEFRRDDGAAGVYSIFGFDHHRSGDAFDPRADWLIDLNRPPTIPERFDLLTNFGTAEHVFNIAAVFRFIHDALKVNGVALHLLPAFGDVSHGFFNIHPMVFFDLATANAYTMLDYVYVDSIDIRCHLHMQRHATDEFDFGSLPIQRADLEGPGLYSKVVGQYFEMFNRHRGLAAQCNVGPKDYSCVALRKTSDAPFRVPVQGAYSSTRDGRYVRALAVP